MRRPSGWRNPPTRLPGPGVTQVPPGGREPRIRRITSRRAWATWTRRSTRSPAAVNRRTATSCRWPSNCWRGPYRCAGVTPTPRWSGSGASRIPTHPSRRPCGRGCAARSAETRYRPKATQRRPAWWEGFVEAAVCYGTLPLLANELFGALDQMYSLAALPLAQGGGRARDLRDILLGAVRVPSQYAWGPELHESFRARLRDAMGAASDVLPPTGQTRSSPGGTTPRNPPLRCAPRGGTSPIHRRSPGPRARLAGRLRPPRRNPRQ